MASGDRFYQLSLRHRPALWGDVGSLLKIEGVVIGGEGAQVVMMLPGSQLSALQPREVRPGTEEWSDWLQRSDNPEILVQGSMEKVFHRKLRYDISGAVQQKVWCADGFKCYFCGGMMGKVQLTIDHFHPLETGGVNDESNFLSCCRRCNKKKGAMDPREFCGMMHVDYDATVLYLANRKLP